MKLVLLSYALIASVFAIALPNPDPVPGFRSWVLNRVENRGLYLSDKLSTKAAEQFKKAETITIQKQKDLLIAKANKNLERASMKGHLLDIRHQVKQLDMDRKIAIALSKKKDLQAEALMERKARKAAEWQQKFHDGLEKKNFDLFMKSDL